jgi:multidrug efflux pump subunit AcrB
MIGMIALAGIIVRNSILLVDFINLQVRPGRAASRGHRADRPSPAPSPSC